MPHHYKFVQNTDCEYFPCHKIKQEEDFNCLFCFCPLYTLKEKCGGRFSYTKEGVKDCSQCTLPHGKNAYEHVMSKMNLIIEKAKKQ